MELLKNLFKKSSQTKTPPTKDFAVEWAFKCGGIDYYEFVDKNNLPYQRGLEALTFYQEMQNGVTNDYLKHHQAAMNKLLSDPKKINLNEIIKLNARLDERLNFIISKDIIYKIASVAFVDKGENCLTYDYKYNEKKIKNWKDNLGDGFFLSQPIKRLIPFLQKQGDTSLMYLRVVEKVEQMQQDILSLAMLEQELKAEKD